MRALVFTGAGGSEVMRLEERPTPVPGEDSIVVAVRFAALNAADLAQRAGTYTAPPGAPSDIPGLEVAGVVAAVGARVTELAQGDRVFGLVGGGGLADSVVVHERHLTQVPHTLSDEEAAAVPEAFITAHDAIVTQGRLASGELLLVNGANGGVGRRRFKSDWPPVHVSSPPRAHRSTSSPSSARRLSSPLKRSHARRPKEERM
jgi:NADPH2:quinone reductase